MASFNGWICQEFSFCHFHKWAASLSPKIFLSSFWMFKLMVQQNISSLNFYFSETVVHPSLLSEPVQDSNPPRIFFSKVALVRLQNFAQLHCWVQALSRTRCPKHLNEWMKLLTGFFCWKKYLSRRFKPRTFRPNSLRWMLQQMPQTSRRLRLKRRTHNHF